MRELIAAHGPGGADAPVGSDDLGRLAADVAAAPRRVTIVVDGHGAATASTEERVLVALERAQGFGRDRKSTRLNSSHTDISRMPSSA